MSQNDQSEINEALIKSAEFEKRIHNGGSRNRKAKDVSRTTGQNPTSRTNYEALVVLYSDKAGGGRDGYSRVSLFIVRTISLLPPRRCFESKSG